MFKKKLKTVISIMAFVLLLTSCAEHTTDPISSSSNATTAQSSQTQITTDAPSSGEIKADPGMIADSLRKVIKDAKTVEELNSGIGDIDSSGIIAEIQVYPTYDFYKAYVCKSSGALLSVATVVRVVYADRSFELFMRPHNTDQPLLYGEFAVGLAEVVRKSSGAASQTQDSVGYIKKQVEAFDSGKCVSDVSVYANRDDMNSGKKLTSGNIDYPAIIKVTYTTDNSEQTFEYATTHKDYIADDYEQMSLILNIADTVRKATTVDELNAAIKAADTKKLITSSKAYRSSGDSAKDTEITSGALKSGDRIVFAYNGGAMQLIK